MADELEERDPRFTDVDSVFHLAAERNPTDAEGHAQSLALTQRLCQAAICYQIPRFIYLSSQSVYGTIRPTPWVETLSPSPESSYAMAKWAGEQLTTMAGQISGVSRVTSVRLARLYGAADGLRWDEVPHKFIREAMLGNPLNITGGKQVFDLLHIRDALRALVMLLDNPPAILEPVYNIGGGNPTNIMQVAEAAVTAAHRRAHTGSVIHLQPDNVPRQVFGMDCSRFQRDTGWQPSITLDQAMDELAQRVDLGGT